METRRVLRTWRAEDRQSDGGMDNRAWTVSHAVPFENVPSTL
jgi:hypothetical protein